jgi:Protein of unknown function (DUF2934)
VAKKSKAEVAPGKYPKIKAAGKSRAAKPKKAVPKKTALQNIQAEVTRRSGSTFDPTDEQIQMRAYFISERRRRFDLPGDANSDWLEAKRQLLAETRH